MTQARCRPWCRPQRTRARAPETHAMSARDIRPAPRVHRHRDISILKPRDRPLLCGPATAHARDGYPIVRPRAAVCALHSAVAGLRHPIVREKGRAMPRSTAWNLRWAAGLPRITSLGFPAARG